MPNYWGYRIDRHNIDFFRTELQENKTLRQGWGYDPRQDLSKPGDYGGSPRNRPIYNNVKKDDILLIPHLPGWGRVAVAKATANFDEGYSFQIPESMGDYGHCFPAEFVTEFHPHAAAVGGDIRTTLRCRCRFWNMGWCSDDIEKILKEKNSKRLNFQTEISRLHDLVAKRDEDESLQKLVGSVHNDLDSAFEGKDWENVLQEMIQELHPDWNVEHVGGRKEVEHGTDLLVTIPSMSADEHAYGIAIQVKDQTELTDHARDQISKSTKYWEEQRALKIIDTYVIVTKAELQNGDQAGDIKVIGHKELDEMIKRYTFLRLAK